MRDSIITFYDEKAKAHLPPWFMHNSEMAIRTFGDCINSDKHQFSQHPLDYTLFIHGSFDNENAEFTLQAAPKSLGNGVEFIEIQRNEKISDEKDRNESPFRPDSTRRNTA